MSLATPPLFLRPFAINGDRNAIPQTTSPGVGSATYDLGFPPVTMAPLTMGGVPPKGKDFNGILYALSAVAAWQNAGMLFVFDAGLASYIGGYKIGAVLHSANPATPMLYWFNTVDGNTNNPDVTSTGWASFSPSGAKYLAANVPSGTSNNFAPAGFDFSVGTLDLTPTGGNALVTGMAAGVEGQLVAVSNLHATNLVTLQVLNGLSTSANQFRGAFDLAIAPMSSVLTKYSSGAGKWILLP